MQGSWIMQGPKETTDLTHLLRMWMAGQRTLQSFGFLKKLAIVR